MPTKMAARPPSASRMLRQLRDEPTWYLVSVAVVVALAILARVLLYQRFPLFLTNDSPDYLFAGERIAAELDFMNVGLRDWRLPGYPLFLALLQRVAKWDSANVLIAQSLGGILCVVLGLAAARGLGWRLGSVVLGMFLALHPVCLLNEHAVMTEAFFILLLWSVTTLAIVILRRRPGFLAGLLLGALFSLCVLTRSNGLLFCVPVIAGLVGFSQRPRGAWRGLLPAALGLLGAVALLVGLWAYRNYLILGRSIPFTNNVQRALLIYQAQHDLVDPELPEIRRFRYDASSPNDSVYRLVGRLGTLGSIEAERVARRIVHEQVREQKQDYLRQVGYSFRHYWGLPIPTRAIGRDDMVFWFEFFVGNFPRAHPHNRRLVTEGSSLEYVAAGRDGRILRWWESTGVWYLRSGRAWLASAFGLAVLVFVLTGGLKPKERADAAILALALGLLSAAAAHAVMLADYDRFAMPFDGFQVLVIVGVAQRALRRRSGPSAPPR